MMIAYSLLDDAIVFEEDKVIVLVIENGIAMRNAVFSLNGTGNDFILSENFKIIDIRQNVEFIYNICNLDFVSKSISTKLNSEAEKIASENSGEVVKILAEVNSLGDLIVNHFDETVCYQHMDNPSGIIKLLNFSIDNSDMSFPEMLLEYMEIQRRYFKKKLFVFLNLKDFVSDAELELFYKNLLYEKFNVLLLESHEDTCRYESEKIYVIDKDLCVL